MVLPPTNGRREAYTAQFMNMLDRKAFALIKYIEGERYNLLCSSITSIL